jgi:hypothetical protein
MGIYPQTRSPWLFSAYNRVLMAAFFVFFFVPLLFLAYGVLCLISPDKHLAFNSWMNLQRRRKWHELRNYTTPDL